MTDVEPVPASWVRTHAHDLVALQQASYRVEAELIGDNRIPQLTETPTQLVAADLRWHVVVDGDAIVAAIATSRLPAGGVDIERLMVDPTHHRRGLGRALVQAAAPGRAAVTTGRENTPARRLYEGLGFRHVEDLEVEQGLWVSAYERRARTRTDQPASIATAPQTRSPRSS